MAKYRIVKQEGESGALYKAQKKSLLGFWLSFGGASFIARGLFKTKELAKEAIENDRAGWR